MIKSDELVVLVPYVGGIDKDHLRCMVELESMGVTVQVVHDLPLIDHARTFLAARALATCPQAVVTLWIDHDILFDPHDVIKLAEQCRDEHPFIAAPYSSRTPGGMIVGGFDRSVDRATFFDGGGVYPAVTVGFGFTAVRRSVFETIGEGLPTLKLVTMGDFPCKPYFAHIWRDGKYYGEDKSFCIRAADIGITPVLDTRIRLFHKGHYRYGIEDVVQKVGRPEAPTIEISHSALPLKGE